MKNINIEYRKVSELIPYEKNPRKNDKAVDIVANSIKEFGFKVPIVVDINDVIITGHTRLKAAKKLGIEEVPVIVASDLTENQVNAYRLADNKTGEAAEWDFDLLMEELDFITPELDMADFGFDLFHYEPTDSEETDSHEADKCPEQFKEFDESIETHNKCPICGYEW